MSLHDIPFVSFLLNDEVINNFHFIRPWWLLSFVALFLAIYLIKKARIYQSPWQHFLPKHLSKVLLDEDKTNSKSTSNNQKQLNNERNWLKPFIIGSCLIIALAGPAWKKLPQPVYQLERGSVLIMDMSYSMFATDIKPNRLTRARFKANDLLAEINEGEIGLIAYAGDAFIISPLTQDIKNIELLLPSLSPDIMPSLGANALSALTLAHETLKNSGHLHGDIYWFTDDIDNEDLADIYSWSNEFGHRLNILGIGTSAGAPIKLSSGELLKDNNGAIVVPKLPEGKLASLAKRGGGNYSTMTSDDSDIKKLTQHLRSDIHNNELTNSNDKEQSTQGDKFQEQGPWLLLIALPFILSYFRRGTGLLSISAIAPFGLLLTLMSLSTPNYVYADDSTAIINENAKEKPKSSLWEDLWQTKDQQAQQYFNKKDYDGAAQQFKHKQWQGSAHYKAGNYEQALESFEKIDTADSLYNQGNALAQMQKYDDAIERYNNALKKDPDLKDAKENLAKVKQAKEEQEKQQQNSDQNSDDQEQKDSDKENSDSQKNGDQEKGDQNNSEQEQSEQQKSEQQQSDSKEQNKNQDQNSSSEQNDENNKENNDAKKDESQAAKAAEEDEQGEKTPAQIANEKKAQEAEQKHRKTLNKVTDDPYLLLRNKMRLEYEKRRHDTNAKGVDKKW
jgi:Ca-activated chloride channel family protein